MKPSQIRLLPLDPPNRQTGYIPFRHARYWRSDIEQADPRQPGTAVFLTPKAYIRANVHAQSDLNNEVGGWLIGNRREDQITGQEYIVIERCLPALYARRGSAYLTFTQDSQVAMFEIMEEKFPDKELVGWYHTHPKMSVFLSNYDLFLHNHFFPHPWQVALVIEPHTNLAGFFIRDRDGNLEARHYFGFYELTGGGKRSLVRWANMEEEFTGSLELTENENE
ncbi:MAG: Mov34/MPN/PAD-1 family protein [Anaerolineales bacterium]